MARKPWEAEWAIPSSPGGASRTSGHAKLDWRLLTRSFAPDGACVTSVQPHGLRHGLIVFYPSGVSRITPGLAGCRSVGQAGVTCLPGAVHSRSNMPSNLELGLYVFMLATFLGLEIIRRVFPPLLHTPLMSLTNAISAISRGGPPFSSPAPRAPLRSPRRWASSPSPPP